MSHAAPGPWEALGLDRAPVPSVVMPDGQVWMLDRAPGKSLKAWAPTARLIAAAPDLLAALKLIIRVEDRGAMHLPLEFDQARAAIAKAESPPSTTGGADA